jgi:hypothetical protein
VFAAGWLDAETLWTAVAVVAALVLLPYVGGPVLIYFTQRLEAEPKLIPFDVDEYDWPRATQKLFDTAHTALTESGFELLSGFHLPSAAPNVKTSLLLFANRETRDSAMATAMSAEGAGATLQTLYVEFTARFSDGRVINTLNTRELGSFPNPPHVTSNYLPGVQDARQLLRIHEILTQDAGSRSQKVLRVDADFDGDAAAYLQFAVRESYEDAVRIGYLFREGRYFKPTVRGAVLMVWKELWPWKMIRRSARDRAARQLLSQIGFRAGVED